MVKLLFMASRFAEEVIDRVEAILMAQPRKYRSKSDFLTQAVLNELDREEQ
jgi:hypothetical protein